MSTPPPPDPGAEVDSFSITNATVNNAGRVDVNLRSFVSSRFNSNDVTISDNATDTIAEVAVRNLGGAEKDVIRFNLASFQDDFTVTVANTSANDLIMFDGVHRFIDNGGGSYSVSYYGADSVLHYVTVNSGTAAAVPYYTPDGIVDGLNTGQVMGVGFTDEQGDAISNGNDVINGNGGNDTISGGGGNDRILGGSGSDSIDGGAGDDTIAGGNGADTVLGGTGNDRILGGAGDDRIFGGADNDIIRGGTGNDSLSGDAGNDDVRAGAGDDTILGGDGDDTLYGGTAQSAGTGSAGVLDWGQQGADGASVASGFTQDTGDIDVSVSFANNGNNAPTYLVETTDTGYVAVGEPFDPNSHLRLYGNGDGATSTTTMAFAASSGSAVRDVVRDVSFRINDVDFASGNHRDVITVNAFDADGNPVTVTLTPAGNDGASGNTITAGNSLDNPQDALGSVRVDIAGPVASIEIIYSNLLTGTQAVWISDVHFTSIPGAATGNDSIVGGAGDDQIFAGLGNDTIDGGTGTDTYDARTAADMANQAISVTVDGSGNGTSVKKYDGSTDTFTSLERFLANEATGEEDEITFTAPVTRSDVAGMDNTAVGYFTSDDTGQSYFFGGAGEPSINDILARTYDPGTGVLRPQGSYTITGGEENGAQIGTYYFEGFETVNFDVVCFARGTRIETGRGEVAIEDLETGDMVRTLDHGLQPIRWIGSTTEAAMGKNAPVLIRKGALGNTRDLRVSPQHRMMLEGWRQELLFGELQTLATAKSLCNDCTIRQVQGGLVEYFHMLFDAHQIVFAEGAPSESFHPGEVGMDSFDNTRREEIFKLFPGLRDGLKSYGPTARVSLKAYEASVMAGALDGMLH